MFALNVFASVSKAELVQCTFAEYKWIIQPPSGSDPDYDLSNLSLIDKQSAKMEIIKDQTANATIQLTTGTTVDFEILITDTYKSTLVKGSDFSSSSTTYSNWEYMGSSGWSSSNSSDIVTWYECKSI